MTAVEEAQRVGFDLSLIEDNLSCDYEKRALQHQAALALELEKIGQQLIDCRRAACTGRLAAVE